MLDRYLHVLTFLVTVQKNAGFVCPKDGRWPHPADCEKFYTCNAGVGVEAWCGNGMTYDMEHGRCDLSKNIDCKNGERPSWIPPAEWRTESVTERVVVKTTPRAIHEETETESQSEMAVKSTTVSLARLIQSRILLPTSDVIENTPCTFQGSMLDPNDCQAYFACKDDVITRFSCPDRHLFDDDLRSCNDYRKVFCSNRPTNDRGDDPCVGRPNGWYANYEHRCRSYYLCTEQRRTKMDECPLGSKWNPHRLRCDDPKYIPAPCGYRYHNNASRLGRLRSYSTLLTLVSFFLFTV